MKKINLLTLAVSLLVSQTGCVGPKQDTAGNMFPYATVEIKEKLAKRIYPDMKTVPENFFERLNYDILLSSILQSVQTGQPNPLSILGETQEEQIFWYYIMRLRVLTPYLTFPRQIDDPGFVIEWLNALTAPIEKFAEENPDKMQSIMQEVIRYEETFPFNPMPNETEIKPVTREEMVNRYGLSAEEAEKITDEFIENQYQEEIEAAREFPREKFNQVRETLLQGYRDAIEQLKSGKSAEEWAEEKKAQAGIAEYAVHFAGPALYPAEMMFAEFTLSPTDEEAVYSYPALFFRNQAPSAINSIRIENEKPLPYKLYLMWYSITENKVYALETELPHEILKAKILDGDGKWDALLFTLEPYGKVTLYAYNQINNDKEELASFKAKAKDIPFARFQKDWAQYDNREKPSTDWKEYRQNALKHFPKAAEVLKTKGRPVFGPEINYWEENPENIFEGLPEEEEINTPDKDGLTPLIDAVRRNKEATVLSLIQAGADVNYQTPSGETALLEAVNMNSVSFARALIAAGADVNKRDTSSGRTPLINAAMNGNNEIVNMLIDAGADKNARVVLYGQELEENALTAALNNGNTETADLLRKSGVEEPAPGGEVSPAAQQAAAAAYEAMGITPLHYALLTGETDKVKELIASGADVNAQSPHMGTPLLYACTVGNAEAARLLVNAKADVNAAGDTGYTPLMMACQTGSKELAELLVSAGADVNAKHVMDGQESGLTPLKIAQDSGFEEIVQILVRAGAK